MRNVCQVLFDCKGGCFRLLPWLLRSKSNGLPATVESQCLNSMTARSHPTPGLKMLLLHISQLINRLCLLFLSLSSMKYPGSLDHFTCLTMGSKRIMVALLIPAMVACMVSGNDIELKETKVGGKRMCNQGWVCKGFSAYCCNQTISKFCQTYQFRNLFSKRNSPVAHAVDFWDYRSFILAVAVYQPLGVGTTRESSCR